MPPHGAVLTRSPYSKTGVSNRIAHHGAGSGADRGHGPRLALLRRPGRSDAELRRRRNVWGGRRFCACDAVTTPLSGSETRRDVAARWRQIAIGGRGTVDKMVLETCSEPTSTLFPSPSPSWPPSH